MFAYFCKWRAHWLLTPSQLYCKFKAYSFFLGFFFSFLLAIQSVNSRTVTIRLLRNTMPPCPISQRDFSFMAKPPLKKRQQNLKDCFFHKNVLFFPFTYGILINIWALSFSCSFKHQGNISSSRNQDKKTLWKSRWSFRANIRWLNLENGKGKMKNYLT